MATFSRVRAAKGNLTQPRSPSAEPLDWDLDATKQLAFEKKTTMQGFFEKSNCDMNPPKLIIDSDDVFV